MTPLLTDAKRDLHYPLLGRGTCDATECGCSKAAVGLGKGWGVGDVEKLSPKFSLGFARQMEVLDESQIEIAIGGTTDRIT